MAGMMPGYYNMYHWAGMAWMMPQMAGMSAAMTGMSGMMPQVAGMSGMMQGQSAAAEGSRVGVRELPGHNVYRPTLDFLTGGSQTCTPLESQFTCAETFSLEELGLSPMREPHTHSPPAGGRRGASKKKGKGRGKGKGVAGKSSQAGARDDGEEERRTVWSEEQCVALSNAWINV